MMRIELITAKIVVYITPVALPGNLFFLPLHSPLREKLPQVNIGRLD